MMAWVVTAVTATGCSTVCRDAGPGGGGALFCADTEQVDGSIPADQPSAPVTSSPTTSTTSDGGTDVDLTPSDPPEALTFATKDPLRAPPADPLATSDLDSCALFETSRCEDGQWQQCALYDTSSQSWATDPPELLSRVLRAERRLELYNSPDGQVVEREFATAPEPGTPEEEWGSLESFGDWSGKSDSALWSSVALEAAILRYLETGTEADYARMEQGVERILTLFEITGLPGYLARYHFLKADPGAPKSQEHIVRTDAISHHDHPVLVSTDALPDDYFEGLPSDDGLVWEATPMWRGNPSIDQYTGPMVSLPAAHGLLRDDALKRRITKQLTCYLHRLRRFDVINLHDNPEATEALTGLFAGSLSIDVDPGDVDLVNRDQVAVFYLPQYNRASVLDVEYGCPAELPDTPNRIIDAADEEFFGEFLDFALDLDPDVERSTSIDHVYLPNLRGADAVHLMHLGLVAWHLTGDTRYTDFVSTTLQEELEAVGVAHTLGAVNLPRWCHAYYGNHIGSTPLWSLINLLDDSPLREEMFAVMHEEGWLRTHSYLDNVKFNLMYAGSVPWDVALDADLASSLATDALQVFGGNGGLLDDPRRTYSRPYDDVVAAMGDDNMPVCPTADERDACEAGIDLYGIPLGGVDISSPCTGSIGECGMADGQCTRTMAAAPLAVELRRYADFAWQRSPFEIGEAYQKEGGTQSPGVDLIEAYWLARYYDFVDDGEELVLAWRDAGSCSQ